MGEGVWMRASKTRRKPPPVGRLAGAQFPSCCPGWSNKCPLPDARTPVKGWRVGQGLGQSGRVKDFLDESCSVSSFHLQTHNSASLPGSLASAPLAGQWIP